jgi:hypothetical protein
MRKRWIRHRCTLLNNDHDNRHLQGAWDKYGRENFVFEVLEKIDDLNILTEREQYWMDRFEVMSADKGYNMCPSAGSMLGHRHSKNTIEKMKQNSYWKGKKLPKYIREKISQSRVTRGVSAGKNNPQYGKKMSDVVKQKISEANKGRKHSKETREKMSKTHKLLVGEKSHMYGKKLSEETKKKMSIVHSGERCHKAKLVWEQVRNIRKQYSTGKYSQNDLAQEYNISRSAIASIVQNRSWIEEKQ